MIPTKVFNSNFINDTKAKATLYGILRKVAVNINPETFSKAGAAVESFHLTLDEFDLLLVWGIFVRTAEAHMQKSSAAAAAEKVLAQYIGSQVMVFCGLEVEVNHISREKRIVQRNGVKIDGIFYYTPELAQYIGNQVMVFRSLDDAGKVWIYQLPKLTYLCEAYSDEFKGQDHAGNQ